MPGKGALVGMVSVASGRPMRTRPQSLACIADRSAHHAGPNKGEYAMKKLLIAFTTLALLGTVADATAPCRNKTTGKFEKCPPSGTQVAAAGGKISAPDAKGRCHVLVPAPGTKQKKGQYVACPK